ncbi:hypothetical protein [Neisseria elongata]|uniref:hypothetical protein n=1 Tax=Neisseria elongata TaxID=495 RepID=UPI00131AD1FD|nr:hypothetical protein [Neisseria elongata]
MGTASSRQIRPSENQSGRHTPSPLHCIGKQPDFACDFKHASLMRQNAESVAPLIKTKPFPNTFMTV